MHYCWRRSKENMCLKNSWYLWFWHPCCCKSGANCLNLVLLPSVILFIYQYSICTVWGNHTEIGSISFLLWRRSSRLSFHLSGRTVSIDWSIVCSRTVTDFQRLNCIQLCSSSSVPETNSSTALSLEQPTQCPSCCAARFIIYFFILLLILGIQEDTMWRS